MTLRSTYFKMPLAIVCLLVGLVFALDVSMPLGVAFGVPYVAVVMAGLWLPGDRTPYILAGLASLLTVAGYFLSVPAVETWMALTNRGVAIFAIWVTAFVGSQRKRAEAEIGKAHEEMENRVKERTMAYSQEIIERKSMEVALRESEIKLRSAIDHLPSIFYHRDKEGRYTLANKVYEKTNALKPGEIIGKNAPLSHLHGVGQPVSCFRPGGH